LLTEAVIKHPYSVVLLDEIEKAHPDIFNLLLQVMDYGTLTDNNGRVANFHHVVLMMTTNAGAEDSEHPKMGFTEDSHRTDDLEAIQRLFSPEFRNRLDAVVAFKPLSEETLTHIVDKFIIELETQLEHKHVRLKVDEASRRYLASHGYDRKMGARPMARFIQEHIKKPLAEELLFGRLMAGGFVNIEMKDDQLSLGVQGLVRIMA
jgi:ATP-dependent Clp protease ATP-binding subunit ClpA